MRFSNKAAAKELSKKLASLSYAGFQQYCREILGEVLPGTAASKEMRKLDQAGVDLFLLHDEEGVIEYGFQCKGVEDPFFGRSQLQQCIHSIRSLEKLDFRLKKYYLVINRDVYKDEQVALQAELGKMKAAEKIESYKILDSRAFINFLSDIITTNFKKSIRESNKKLYNQYTESLQQQFYYADVPFELNEHRVALNPSAFLEKSFEL